MDTPKITADMAGTWLEGSHGWHNAYRVVDRACEYGFVLNDDDAAALERFRADNYEGLSQDDELSIREGISELADEATAHLQSLAPKDFDFEWEMGELALVELALSDDYEINEITISYCDGIFLILDTAKHVGTFATRREIRAHVAECESCHEHNSDLSWM